VSIGARTVRVKDEKQTTKEEITMKQYLMSVQLVDGTPPPAPEEMQAMFDRVGALNSEIRDSGAWVFAGGLHERSTATVARVAGGEVLITDGPFSEAKEYIGGFWIIQADDLDAALKWAAKATEACGAPVEVRPFEEANED
jgi:hypothetical protein